MPTIEPQVKKYIDATVDNLELRLDKKIELAIERERIIFINEMSRHTAALSEHFIHEMKMGFEALQDRPTETRVREIVHEEIESIKFN